MKNKGCKLAIKERASCHRSKVAVLWQLYACIETISRAKALLATRKFAAPAAFSHPFFPAGESTRLLAAKRSGLLYFV